MTDIQNTPSQKPHCRRKKILCLLFILLVLSLPVGLYFCPWLINIYAGQSTERITALETKIAALEARLNNQPTLESGTDAKATDLARIQSDMAALTTAMSALQTEVKQTGSSAIHSEKTAQASLAAAMTFIQLREAASSGQSYVAELSSMNEATKKDPSFVDLLAPLQPYAATGTPSAVIIRDEFLAREPAALKAIEKAAAQNWWQRLLAEMKGLVSIRPLHGGSENEAFTAIEENLAKGDIAATLASLDTLPPEAQTALADWRKQAEARVTIDNALRAITARFIGVANTVKPAEDTP